MGCRNGYHDRETTGEGKERGRGLRVSECEEFAYLRMGTDGQAHGWRGGRSIISGGGERSGRGRTGKPHAADGGQAETQAGAVASMCVSVLMWCVRVQPVSDVKDVSGLATAHPGIRDQGRAGQGRVGWGF